jgi:hypothetical protein
MSIVGCATIVALACGHAARATAPDADLATLTLNAEYDGTPGETSFNDGLIVTASGAGGTLSGPPGTSGSLPPGSYDLSVEETDPEGDVYYSFGPATCSNVPSGALSVTLGPGDVVTCTFRYLVALPSRPTEEPNLQAPNFQAPNLQTPAGAVDQRRQADAMPVSGSDTLLLTLFGTMLLSAGGGLVLLARGDHAGRFSAVSSTNMGGPRGRRD